MLSKNIHFKHKLITLGSIKDTFMKSKKILFIHSILLFFMAHGYFANCQDKIIDEYATSIPTMGNSWVINHVDQSSSILSKEGITKWTNPDYVIRTYFYMEKSASISLGIHAKVESGTSEIEISFAGQSKSITLSNKELKKIYIGDFELEQPGYHFIEIHGVKKDSDTFANIKELLINQEDDINTIKFIKDDFYFGRRGPSTHLVYQVPAVAGDIEWFYNEIEIEKGQDVIGSYFMANGFAEGYFGIQVNSETERRILFSVWSPYKTDDPSSIPEEYRITLLKKGKDVTTGKFGNEGSGGQSYKKFNWEAGKRYGFLLGAKPTGGNSTDFTAYFFDPEMEEWQLIASFRRPKTDTHLRRLYSFLENFIPNTGVLDRKGGYYNQWVYSTKGEWIEINEAKFSADNTARKDARFDYSGGLGNDGFYLKNCGFTNDHTVIGEMLIREKMDTPPNIEFKLLE